MKIDIMAQAALLKQKESAGKKIAEIKAGLPHLYERGWYQWAWDFFKSKNRINLLCAANQISKSSSQIRKTIEWAGNPKLWPELWPNLAEGQVPKQFWYFYPDGDTVKGEVENKWVPEFLPRGAYKEHPSYGWKIIYGERRTVDSIQFKSGVRVYFKTYSQKAVNLQSASVFAVFTDEELPGEYYPEIQARMFSTEGYFHMVFTCTRNQDMWKRAIEGRGETELFPDAFKQQISMYECMSYRDGKPGAYNAEKIERIIKSCSSDAEVQRRVYGKFVMATGLKFGNFDASRHYKKPTSVPESWRRYCGVDIGSGGFNHKPAIVFIAARPDFRYGVVYKAWRGDDGSTYTAGDVFNKFLEMRKNEVFVSLRYDWAAKDFGTIATRAGEGFVGAEKNHDLGEDVINTLFKNNMLYLFDDEDIGKLGGELSCLLKDEVKNRAKDDLCDAFRYGVTCIPWDWMYLKGEKSELETKKDEKKPYTEEEIAAFEISERRKEFDRPEKDDWGEIEDEFREWNSFAGS